MRIRGRSDPPLCAFSDTIPKHESSQSVTVFEILQSYVVFHKKVTKYSGEQASGWGIEWWRESPSAGGRDCNPRSARWIPKESRPFNTVLHPRSEPVIVAAVVVVVG